MQASRLIAGLRVEPDMGYQIKRRSGRNLRSRPDEKRPFAADFESACRRR
jgi:hypothetical protein